MTIIPAVSLLFVVLIQSPALCAQENLQAQAAFGAKIYVENCSRCHEPPDPVTRDDQAWKAISLHMRLFADLSRDEQAKVLAFLRTFNAPKKD